MKPLDPRLARHAAAVRPFLAASAGCAAGGAALAVGQAWLLADIISSAYQRRLSLAALTLPLALLGAVVLGRAAVVGLQEWLARITSLRVQAQLRKQLLHKVFELGPGWLSSQRSGELALLATRGIRSLDAYFAQYLPQLLATAIVPPIVLALLLPADRVAFATVLVTVPLIPVFMALVGLTTQERSARQWEALGRLGHHFLDVVSGLTTLRVYGRSRRQAQVIARVSDEYRRRTMSVLRLAFLSSLVLELLATLSMALVAVGIGLRLLAGDLDLRTALFVLVLAPEAYLPLRKLGAAHHACAEAVEVSSSLFAVLEEDDGRDQSGGDRRRSKPTAALDLTAVTVRRDGRAEAVVAGVDLAVRSGELVVLTGPSGCGKSTLCEAVLGFAPITSGAIATGLPGEPVRDLATSSAPAWRAQFAYVPQRPHTFAGTVADNARLGAPDATDAQVRAALAQAGDLLAEMPEGLGTVLGDGGFGLSTGQVRRLALARALILDRPILILDEPTAGLDAASEARVVETLAAQAQTRAVLVVSHRPAVLAAATRAVVLGSQALEPAA